MEMSATPDSVRPVPWAVGTLVFPFTAVSAAASSEASPEAEVDDNNKVQPLSLKKKKSSKLRGKSRPDSSDVNATSSAAISYNLTNATTKEEEACIREDGSKIHRINYPDADKNSAISDINGPCPIGNSKGPGMQL